MIQIGQYNTLTVTRLFKGGCFLSDDPVLNERETEDAERARNAPGSTGPGTEIYLPKGDTPKGAGPGDTINVFIYNEAKEKIGATTQTPKAVVGDFASLEVTSVTGFGAFLDWGISKDLFVPKKYWRYPLQEGDNAVVYLTLDYEKKGVIGTCHISDHFINASGALEPNRKVSLIVWDISDLGVSVIIDNRYSGLLYRQELFETLTIGDTTEGYVKKVREDGLVDAALRPQGFKESTTDARDDILNALSDSNGFLPLTDKSPPDQIKERLGMSKKLFKKTVGGLYKDGTISIEESGIRLVASRNKKR